jgi:hypothetical protein
MPLHGVIILSISLIVFITLTIIYFKDKDPY